MRALLLLTAVICGPHMLFMYAGACAMVAVVLAIQGNWWFVAPAFSGVVCWTVGMSGMQGVLTFARDKAFFLVASGRVKLTDEGDKIKVTYVGGES